MMAALAASSETPAVRLDDELLAVMGKGLGSVHAGS